MRQEIGRSKCERQRLGQNKFIFAVTLSLIGQSLVRETRKRSGKDQLTLGKINFIEHKFNDILEDIVFLTRQRMKQLN